MIYADKQYFYRKDAQGNIVAILDRDGNIVVKYIYDCWGNHAVIDANGQDIVNMQHIGNLNPFRYRSYYYDTETGLYYLQTRYYDPELGRFISQDSIEYADYESVNGLNLFAYCGNNPVNNIDPMGTWSWKKFWAGLGLVATAVAAIAISVATFGAGTPIGITMVAGVTLAAGVLTGVNGIATMVEAGTNYNFMRDGVFQGNEKAYNWYAGITEGVAAAGTLILGVYNATGYAKATRYGRKFLGKGYSKVGKNRWVSADGLRQMRFDDSHHILDGIKTENHFNLDMHASNMLKGRSEIIKKLHVFYKMFKIWFR